jgi:hypothetical protein
MATQEHDNIPDRVDLRVLAGSPFSVALAVLQADGEAMAASSITSARAHVRASVGGQDILHIFSTEDDPADASIGGGATGAVTLTATSETTSLWQAQWPGQAPETVVWWDLEITDGDDETHQITAPGTLTLVWQVTR